MRLLKRLLDGICPVIPFGQLLPYGLSRGRPGSGPDTERFRLHLPLFYWKGVDYLAAWDCERNGWWIQTVMVGVIRTPGGFDVQFRTGAWPRSRKTGLIKHPWTCQWMTEEDYLGGPG